MKNNKPLLPGEDLVAKGIDDLSSNNFSIEALLVMVGSPRLNRLGHAIPLVKHLPSSPEHALYQKLESENPKNGHSRYNALIRRLVSYERALESGF